MGIKCQLDATEAFIADLIACSTCFGHHYAHHQELKSIIQWLLPVIFRAVVFKLLVWCGAEGYVSGLQDAAASCKPLGRPRHRWEDNIKMDLQVVGCGCMDWIELAQDRDGWRALVNAVMNLPVL